MNAVVLEWYWVLVIALFAYLGGRFGGSLSRLNEWTEDHTRLHDKDVEIYNLKDEVKEITAARDELRLIVGSKSTNN